MICNDTTWVPHWHIIAGLCHQLRALYFQHNIQGAANQGLGGRNCATIFYRRHPGGNICHVTDSSESGVGTNRHSEIVCRDEMMARENWTLAQASAQILMVYTERFPCGPQNANCFNVLSNWLQPATPVFWSFEWPDEKDLPKAPTPKRKKGDDDKDKEERARKAKQLRAAGTRDLKHSTKDIDYKNSGKVVTHGAVQVPTLVSAIKTYTAKKQFPNPAPRADF